MVTIVLLIFIISFSYWNYIKNNSNRVVHGIDFNDEVFQTENFKYTDLAVEVREIVTREEFNQWETWNDVKRSFENVSQIENSGDLSFIYHENPIGVIYTYYDFTFFGYKLRYIKFEN